jgi:hypothetical protein
MSEYARCSVSDKRHKRAQGARLGGKAAHHVVVVGDAARRGARLGCERQETQPIKSLDPASPNRPNPLEVDDDDDDDDDDDEEEDADGDDDDKDDDCDDDNDDDARSGRSGPDPWDSGRRLARPGAGLAGPYGPPPGTGFAPWGPAGDIRGSRIRGFVLLPSAPGWSREKTIIPPEENSRRLGSYITKFGGGRKTIVVQSIRSILLFCRLGGRSPGMMDDAVWSDPLIREPDSPSGGPQGPVGAKRPVHTMKADAACGDAAMLMLFRRPTDRRSHRTKSWARRYDCGRASAGSRPMSSTLEIYQFDYKVSPLMTDGLVNWITPRKGNQIDN